MLQVGQITLLVYSFLVLIGGILGGTKGSKISVFAGMGSAVLLILTYFLCRANPRIGFGIATALALVLAGRFWGSFQKADSPPSAHLTFGVLLVGSIVAAVVFVTTLLQAKK